MPRLLLKAWCSNQDYNADCDYGVVDLTPELARKCLRRLELFDQLKATDSNLTEMNFWDYSVDFVCNDFILADGSDVDLSSELFTTEDGKLHEHEVVELKIDLPEDVTQSTEYDRMQVSIDGVRWTATPKHCSFDIETAELNRKLLEEVDRASQRPEPVKG